MGQISFSLTTAADKPGRNDTHTFSLCCPDPGALGVLMEMKAENLSSSPSKTSCRLSGYFAGLSHFTELLLF